MRAKENKKHLASEVVGVEETPDVLEKRENNFDNLRPLFGDFLRQKFEESKKVDIHSIDSFYELEKLEDWVADLVDEKDSWSEGLITSDLRKGTRIFLEELINFVKEKSSLDSEEEKKELSIFIAFVDESWFSVSPSIANLAGLEGLIDLSVKATRVPEVQG